MERPPKYFTKLQKQNVGKCALYGTISVVCFFFLKKGSACTCMKVLGKARQGASDNAYLCVWGGDKERSQWGK